MFRLSWTPGEVGHKLRGTVLCSFFFSPNQLYLDVALFLYVLKSKIYMYMQKYIYVDVHQLYLTIYISET